GDGNPDKAPPELVAVLPSPGPKAGYVCVTFSLDGKLLLAGTDDGKLTVWDLSANRVAPAVPLHKGRLAWVQLNPNRKGFATSGRDGKVYLRALNGAAVGVYSDKGGDYCCLAYGPDGKYLAMSSFGGHGGILRVRYLGDPRKDPPL